VILGEFCWVRPADLFLYSREADTLAGAAPYGECQLQLKVVSSIREFEGMGVWKVVFWLLGQSRETWAVIVRTEFQMMIPLTCGM
jgi:hypothetical protein